MMTKISWTKSLRRSYFLLVVGAIISTAIHAHGATSSEAVTVHTGDIGASVLEWAAAAFTTIVGTAATAFLSRWFAHLGVQMTDDMRARLQGIVVNGLNLAAKEAEAGLRGKGIVEVKNEVAARTIKYVQDHGKDTLKALGLDPMSPAAVEAIKARIETAITDPAAPTPALVTPPQSVPVVAVAQSKT